MNPRSLALLGGLCLASVAAADECEHRAERSLDIDAPALSALKLRAGAGSLAIRGEAGLDRIEVRGVACASEAEWLDGIVLVHRTDGDLAVVETRIPDHKVDSWFGNSYRRLDLEVRMPARLLLDAADSSGELRLSGVAGATIVDSSGDIEAEDIAGNATIEVDSSGDIVLQQVRGNAEVTQDSSGGIRFADIDGDASVGNDSSGSIEAVRIGRDFTVRSDSTGGISHRDVTGEVRIPAR